MFPSSQTMKNRDQPAREALSGKFTTGWGMGIRADCLMKTGDFWVCFLYYHLEWQMMGREGDVTAETGRGVTSTWKVGVSLSGEGWNVTPRWKERCQSLLE